MTDSEKTMELIMDLLNSRHVYINDSIVETYYKFISRKYDYIDINHALSKMIVEFVSDITLPNVLNYIANNRIYRDNILSSGVDNGKIGK